MTISKTLRGVLTLLSLIFITACSLSGNDKPQNEHNGGFSSSNTIEMGLDPSPYPVQDKVEKRIKEDLIVIRTKVNQLDLKLEKVESNLTTTAQLKSTQLKEDLERLEKNLEQTMADVKNASAESFNQKSLEVATELEQVEDELAQINAELQEWYDKNLN